MFCTKCGKELKDGMQFCTHCGAKVTETNVKGAYSTTNTISVMSGEIKTTDKVEAGKNKKIAVIAGIGIMVVIVAVFFIFLNTNMTFRCAILKHQWLEATCEHSKTCTVCGRIEGEKVEHQWQAATCVVPKTCVVCGLVEGEKLLHQWQEATCTNPRTCILCGITSGTQNPHQWQEATYDTPQTCGDCGVQEGEPLRGVIVTETNDRGKEVKEYDYQGILTKTSYFHPDGSLRSLTNYMYDSTEYDGEVIKIVAAISYNEDGSETGDYEESYFNEQGKLIYNSAYYYYSDIEEGVCYEYYYTYDEQGKLVEEWDVYHDLITYYQYDQYGNMIQENYNETLKDERRYEYDTAGNIVKCATYLEDGTLYGWYEYTYDENGNQTKISCYEADGHIDNWTEYVYDAQDNVVSITSWYEGDGSYSVTEYEYDFMGNSPKHLEYNEDGSVILEII
uniref:zinc-ribbon domain-containing protein n=1 Tax=Acetatifactor sp. TaxID=1872090 RepID=UPI0040575052